MANLLVETFQVMGLIFYQILCSIFRVFVPNPKKNIQGEIVFMTGAGSGLGRLMSLRFAKLGAIVACADINKQANDAVVEEIKSLGGEAYGYKCDCSSREDIYRVADLVKQQVGHVTILVNNAGIVSGKKFLDTDDRLIQKTMEVNTMAHFWTTKAFLPDMLSKNHGHIVNIASSAGLNGTSGLVDYCVSKFGAVGFDESLRMELYQMKKTGVHTTVVCPSYINTGMFDGVKLRFPKGMPLLEPNWVVDNIMDAVLRNIPVLYLPKSLYFYFVLKSILPCSSFHTITDYLGIGEAMESFKGRAKKD